MQLDRREFIGASIAASAGLAAGGPAQAQQRDTIRFAVGGAQVVSLDPVRLTQGADFFPVVHIYDYLARMPHGTFETDPAKFVPELATKWESSPDAKVWTFVLRQGVLFHKGYGELTSEDIKFTFDRARDPKSGSLAVLYDNIAEIQADEKYVAKFLLKKPDPFFFASVVARISSCIVCKKAVLERGDRFALDPIGTGPYQVVSSSQKLVQMTANKDYFDGPPLVPNFEAQYILDASARTLALLSGAVEATMAPGSPGAIAAIQQRDPTMIMDVALPGNSWIISFNLTKKPFDNLKVRQAFMYSIDREKIAKSLVPPTPRSYGLLPQGFPAGFGPTDTPADLRYDFNPAKAKQLLAEAGYPNGLTFACYCTARDDYSSLMLIVQDQLKQAGITMDLTLVEHAKFHSDNRRNLNTFVLKGDAYPPVPTFPYGQDLSLAALVKDDGTGAGQNYSQYGKAIPGLDELLDKAMNEPDIAKRTAICVEIETKILRDLPIIPLCTTAYVNIHSPRLKMPYVVKSGYGHWRLNKASL